MFQMWRERTHRPSLLESGKRKRGCSNTPSWGHSHSLVSARTYHCIPAISQNTNINIVKTACVLGKIFNNSVNVLLDSGASCSVICASHIPHTNLSFTHTTLLNADGRQLTPLGTLTTTVDLGILTASHNFIVVQQLSVPAILGCDFLSKHGVILDFEQGVFHTKHTSQVGALLLQRQHSCMAVLDDEHPQAVPVPSNTDKPLDMPVDYHPAVSHVLQEYSTIFKQDLGHTTVTDHVIDTGDSHPIKVPPRPIPFHYAERVHQQLQDMAKEGIIRPSSSPWCAPAVYVPKSNGEIRICVDFVQLN